MPIYKRLGFIDHEDGLEMYLFELGKKLCYLRIEGEWLYGVTKDDVSTERVCKTYFDASLPLAAFRNDTAFIIRELVKRLNSNVANLMYEAI